MATATGTYVCDNSTLANFKSWAQAISNAISAFGWTQTSDTGQVNWSTIGAVPSSTYVYEIWKASDSLAATQPIYMKVEYGNSSTQVGVRFTIGTGSNGSGTLTGNVTGSGTPWLGTTTANQGASLLPCYFSGDSASFRMLMWENPVTSSGALSETNVFIVERSHDSSGANTSDYVTAIYGMNNAGVNYARQQSLNNSNLGTQLQTGVACVANSASTALAFGTVAAFPFFPVVGKVGNPLKGLLAVAAGDVADQAIVTVNDMYGGSHTYLAFSGSTFSGRLGGNGSGTVFGSVSYLMLYE